MHPEGIDGRLACSLARVAPRMGVEQHLHLGLQAVQHGGLVFVGQPGAHIAQGNAVERRCIEPAECLTARKPAVCAVVHQRNAILCKPGGHDGQQRLRFGVRHLCGGQLAHADLVERDMPVAGGDKRPGLLAGRFALLQAVQGRPGGSARGQAQGLGQGALMGRGEILCLAAVGGGALHAAQKGRQVGQLQRGQCLLAAWLVYGGVGDDQMGGIRHGPIVRDATMLG